MTPTDRKYFEVFALTLIKTSTGTRWMNKDCSKASLREMGDKLLASQQHPLVLLSLGFASTSRVKFDIWHQDATSLDLEWMVPEVSALAKIWHTGPWLPRAQCSSCPTGWRGPGCGVGGSHHGPTSGRSPPLLCAGCQRGFQTHCRTVVLRRASPFLHLSYSMGIRFTL